METLGKEATISHVIGIEGGFVNNPSDPGGATKYGITLNTLRRVNPHATVDTVRNMTVTQAVEIYIELYWNEFYIDDYPVDIQDVVFDSFVQYSPKTASTIIQKAVNSLGKKVAVDGVISDYTFDAIDEVDVKALRTAILNQRKSYYENLAASHPSQEQFLGGWLNRLKQLI